MDLLSHDYSEYRSTVRRKCTCACTIGSERSASRGFGNSVVGPFCLIISNPGQQRGSQILSTNVCLLATCVPCQLATIVPGHFMKPYQYQVLRGVSILTCSGGTRPQEQSSHTGSFEFPPQATYPALECLAPSALTGILVMASVIVLVRIGADLDLV